MHGSTVASNGGRSVIVAACRVVIKRHLLKFIISSIPSRAVSARRSGESVLWLTPGRHGPARNGSRGSEMVVASYQRQLPLIAEAQPKGYFGKRFFKTTSRGQQSQMGTGSVALTRYPDEWGSRRRCLSPFATDHRIHATKGRPP